MHRIQIYDKLSGVDSSAGIESDRAAYLKTVQQWEEYQNLPDSEKQRIDDADKRFQEASKKWRDDKKRGLAVGPKPKREEGVMKPPKKPPATHRPKNLQSIFSFATWYAKYLFGPVDTARLLIDVMSKELEDRNRLDASDPCQMLWVSKPTGNRVDVAFEDYRNLMKDIYIGARYPKLKNHNFMLCKEMVHTILTWVNNGDWPRDAMIEGFRRIQVHYLVCFKIWESSSPAVLQINSDWQLGHVEDSEDPADVGDGGGGAGAVDSSTVDAIASTSQEAAQVASTSEEAGPARRSSRPAAEPLAASIGHIIEGRLRDPRQAANTKRSLPFPAISKAPPLALEVFEGRLELNFISKQPTAEFLRRFARGLPAGVSW